MGAGASAFCLRAPMITYSRQPVLPIAADGDALRRALRRAEVAHDSRLLVTGPAGLTALLWLYRHDYPGAVYVHANRLAAWPTPTDALVIPSDCRATDLAEMLGDGRAVRLGGALIVQAPAANADQILTVPAVLDAVGFEVAAQLPGRNHSVYVAKRVSLGSKRAA